MMMSALSPGLERVRSSPRRTVAYGVRCGRISSWYFGQGGALTNLSRDTGEEIVRERLDLGITLVEDPSL